MGHLRDLWMSPGQNGRKVRNERWGKGGRWQARWSENGVEKTKIFRSKDGAELHLARVEIEGPDRYTTLTVAEYAKIWQASQLHYAPGTKKAVADRLSAHILPALGHMRMVDVTRADVQAAVGVWSEKLAPASVRQAYSFTTSMFGTAAGDKLIPETPCVKVNVPKRQRNRVIPPTHQQVANITAAFRPWFQSMVIVGAATGMRPAELRGLTVDRLVGGGDVLIDRQLLEVVNRRPVFGPPKSQAGYRRIALGQVAKETLERHMQRFPPGPDGLIWTTRQRGPVNRNAAALAWRNATDSMGFHDRTGWHYLRHYHASVLIEAGFSPKAVAVRLGHADEAETLRTYAHLWPSDDGTLVAVIDAALGDLLVPYFSVTEQPESEEHAPD